MAYRSIGILATAAVALLAVACDQAPLSSPNPADPSFATSPVAPVFTFSGNPSVGNASKAYFNSNDQKTADGYIARMQTGSSGSRLDAGYDLLSLTGKVSRGATAGDTAAGAALVRQTIQCMFDVDAADNTAGQEFFGWPTAAQFDFGRALAATAGGAFFVRGGANTNSAAGVVDPVSAPVVANDVSRIPLGGEPKDGNVSGMGPDAIHNWRLSTTGKTGILTDRVLIYGQPVTDGYDWKLIPRFTTTFNPNVTVALCTAATTATGTSADMVTQTGIGVLGYVSADAICATDPANLALGGSTLERMTRFATRLLVPAPLQATAVATLSGGTARTAKGDVFKVRSVQNVQLTLALLVPGTKTPKAWPANLTLNTGILGDILVDVQTASDPKTPVGGVTVSLGAVNNNGFTQVGEFTGGKCVAVQARTTESVVSLNGATAATQVTWPNACITKTGTVKVVASSLVSGRSGGIGSAAGPNFNVKPK